ncbi:TRAP transporter small permease [Paenalkalicoccus suaedae]|uniref:TRAP transporter small permease n=1 Tax=Paenalkalicoccus suaedae TaxID=2592382 RepID=A0A859FFN3_9BACI|nr:TRAP transporter small permease [Paenalkalicoccus suaedae]QKS72173.1 TRAP transporter small permease [Paenalkalicoccus suaedae]
MPTTQNETKQKGPFAGVVKVVKVLDAALHTVEKFILSWAMIMIAFLTAGNVISRELTGVSWFFSAELSRLALIVASFIGISYAARKGRHISMSAFFDMAPKKPKKFLAIFNPLLTATILFVVAYYAALYTIDVYESGRTTAALRFPFWLMVVAIPIGCFLGGLQYLRNMWMNIKHKEVYLAQDKKDYTEQL